MKRALVLLGLVLLGASPVLAIMLFLGATRASAEESAADTRRVDLEYQREKNRIEEEHQRKMKELEEVTRVRELAAIECRRHGGLPVTAYRGGVSCIKATAAVEGVGSR